MNIYRLFCLLTTKKKNKKTHLLTDMFGLYSHPKYVSTVVPRVEMEARGRRVQVRLAGGQMIGVSGDTETSHVRETGSCANLKVCPVSQGQLDRCSTNSVTHDAAKPRNKWLDDPLLSPPP